MSFLRPFKGFLSILWLIIRLILLGLFNVIWFLYDSFLKIPINILVFLYLLINPQNYSFISQLTNGIIFFIMNVFAPVFIRACLHR